MTPLLTNPAVATSSSPLTSGKCCCQCTVPVVGSTDSIEPEQPSPGVGGEARQGVAVPIYKLVPDASMLSGEKLPDGTARFQSVAPVRASNAIYDDGWPSLRDSG